MRRYVKLFHTMLMVLVMLSAVLEASVAAPFEDRFNAAKSYDDGLAAYNRCDYVTAYQLWRPLADQGLAKAEASLGIMYQHGWGVPQDYAEAVKWYRKAANQGEARAQNNLGVMYAHGSGMSQDYAEALKWYRKAADQGNVHAQNNLAYLYQNGHGVAKNYAEALKWYRKAADQGNVDAQTNLGYMYENGQGVSQDYAEAVKWFRKAADQGNDLAQANLGSMYQNGQGVSQDYAEAMKWHRKAADQGNAIAQANLGSGYANGMGVPQDYVQAYMWLNIAVSKFSASDQAIRDDAIKRRDFIASKMSPAQMAEAQALAREWRPRSPQTANFAPNTNASPQTGVPMKKVGGTFVVPVEINGKITLDFTIDSGAAVVTVPADVFSTLARMGAIRDTDIVGEETYVLADGSKSQSFTFTIKSLKVGDMVVDNVKGGVAPLQGALLLGQSFLERFKSWSIDNTRHVLLLEPQQALPKSDYS